MTLNNQFILILKKAFILLLFFLFLSSALNAEKPLYISLGVACTTSIMLERLNLRDVAFPFDWVITPLDSLIDSFNTDFAYFFTNLRVLPSYPGDGLIDYYGLKFYHVNIQNSNSAGFDRELAYFNNDFIYRGWHRYMPDAKQMFQRRINRLKKACLGRQKVCFIRSAATQDQGDILSLDAVRLRDTIRKNYPNLDFCLIIIGASVNYKKPWNLKDIKNYYGYPAPDTLWESAWKELLEDACSS